jgi:hypothetical protein
MTVDMIEAGDEAAAVEFALAPEVVAAAAAAAGDIPGRVVDKEDERCMDGLNAKYE